MKLTAKQKQILVEAFNRGERNYTGASRDTMAKLEVCKDSETLYTDASRFLSDYQSELTYGRKTPQELKEWVKAY